MALFCPLHIWDRELDSRILTGVLASSQGITSAIGHEYNLSEIYSDFECSHLFRHGRPRNNYRIKWNNNIIKNNGYATIVDEEGSNDLEFNQKYLTESYLPGVDETSIDLCSNIQTWCTLQEELIKESVESHDLKIKLKERMTKTLNSRLELLLPHNRHYFKRRADTIKNFFGDYVLISDNFGTDGFGGIDNSDHRGFLGKDANAKTLQEMKEQYQAIRSQSMVFAKTIKELIISNPDIQFIFRPHPIGSPLEWAKILGEYRNLYIMYKDTIEPWIMSSTVMIHAGCTTGLQGFFLDADIVDISEMLPLRPGQEALSTKVSQKVSSQNELNNVVRQAWSASKKKDSCNDNNYSITRKREEVILKKYGNEFEEYTKNSKSALHKLNKSVQKELEMGKSSSINRIIQSTQKIRDISTNVIIEANQIAEALNKTKNQMLSPGKISFLNGSEIEQRIIDAAKTLNCSKPQHFYSESRRILVIAGQKV